MYGEKGYRFATAQYTVEDVGPNERKVIFTVDEGDRVRISNIEFEGNTVFTDSRLRLTMRNTKESAFISRISKKDLYDPAKLQEDLDKVRDLYRGAGYKNIVIGDPKIEVKALNAEAEHPRTSSAGCSSPSRSRRGTAGSSARCRSRGTRSTRAAPAAGLRAQDDRLAALQGDRRRGQGDHDAYHNTGYIFARVEPELVEREGPGRRPDHPHHRGGAVQGRPHRVPGQRTHQGQGAAPRAAGLRGRPGQRDGDPQQRHQGQPARLLQAQRGEPGRHRHHPRRRRSTLFKGEESDRTELQFGGGWSQLDGFFGQFSISTKNFLGRGEQVGVSVQTGKVRDYYDLSYSIPWFLDRPQSSASVLTRRASTTTCTRTRTLHAATARAWCSPTGGTSGSSSRRASATTCRSTATRR